jgi:hypothetical protein
LCLDDCFATTIITQLTEITQFIFGQPLKEEALKIAKDLEDRQTQHSSTDASIALAYLGLGDKNQAMTWLNKAYQARFNPSILARPAFDSLRSDTRFQDLLRRIGLPLDRRS